MLSNDTLSQLAGLKKDIILSKDYGTGRVVGSNGRYGFVKLDDGRDVYLSPELMQHVIPGDVIKVCIENGASENGKDKGKKNKLEAVLEKLITPAISRFVGRYRIKGNAHFVEPSGAQASRWIFLPPKVRGKQYQDGDYVIAKITTHPFQTGKAAAKILEKIGSGDEPKFELGYVKAKYQLNIEESPQLKEQSKTIEKQVEQGSFGDRLDLSDIPFVTIDAEMTRDMDDALAIEALEDNDKAIFRLHVAIADPSHFIEQSSPLAQRAGSMGQSAYLLGGTVPMLPTALSHHSFSLEAGKKRPALVCHLDFDASGEIQDAKFEFAIVESKHKLSYDNVTSFLDNDTDSVPEECKAALRQLKELSCIRRQFRDATFIIAQDQQDYSYKLDDKGRIEGIQQRERGVAHQIVEEAMLATNTCAAYLLSKHSLGLCSAHKGFRAERLGEVKALLKEEGVEHGDLQSLEDHVSLFRDLAKNEQKAKLVGPLRRMMESAELSTEAAPHLGMGVPGYTTITSPIRRFADLYNHWALQKILEDKGFEVINEHKLSTLSEALQNTRQADRELSLWLTTLYTESLIDTEAVGKVRIVTQHGFGVRLNEWGIEGFVLFPKSKEKKYDAKRMTLKVDDVTYEIGSDVSIKIASVDKEKNRIAFTV